MTSSIEFFPINKQDREVREFKKLNREKSFDEARTAVQSQIERMFLKVRKYPFSINISSFFKI